MYCVLLPIAYSNGTVILKRPRLPIQQKCQVENSEMIQYDGVLFLNQVMVPKYAGCSIVFGPITSLSLRLEWLSFLKVEDIYMTNHSKVDLWMYSKKKP